MKPTPKGWPRLSTAIFYQDAKAAIDWLCKAFGFEVRLKVEGEGGRIEHSELVYGDAVIMVGSDGLQKDKGRNFRSPRSVDGACTQAAFVYIDDADAHCARARAAGAVIVDEPKLSDYGPEHWVDKNYGASDLEGHHWWFAERVRD